MSKPKNKNPDNPFSGLDSSLFPKTGNTGGTTPAKDPKQVPVKSQEESDPNEADAALFLLAVSAATRLNRNARARPDTGETPAPLAGLLEERNARKAEQDKATRAEKKASGPHSLFRLQNPQAPSPERALSASAGRSPSVPDKAVLPENGPPLENDELAFFSAVKGVTALPGKGREIPAPPEPAPVTVPRSGNPLLDIVEGRVEFALNSTDEYVEGHVVGLDLLTVGKLQARQYSPESHIDLHGLNSDQAYQNLVSFFRSAYYKGVRTALIVTGRGRNSLCGVPVLRRKVQEWLVQDPFRRVVLAFCTAKREDGGPGALYVLLRKYRKNSGKVRWDATPADPDLLP